MGAVLAVMVSLFFLVFIFLDEWVGAVVARVVGGRSVNGRFSSRGIFFSQSRAVIGSAQIAAATFFFASVGGE
jgi:hypothetical protein